MCQSEDLVALAKGAKVNSVFFSDNGALYLRLHRCAPHPTAPADTQTVSMGSNIGYEALRSASQWAERGNVLAGSSCGKEVSLHHPQVRRPIFIFPKAFLQEKIGELAEKRLMWLDEEQRYQTTRK